MPGTVDDLIRIGEQLRTELAHKLDEVIKVIHDGGSKSGGAGGGGSATPAAAPVRGDNFAQRLERFATSTAKAAVGLAAFTVMFDRMISGLGQALTKFVATANPTAVLRFNLAVENAQSALGRVLLPVMERFTAMIQAMGDAIESLSPAAKSLIASFAAGAGLTAVLGGAAAAVALLVSVLGGWVTALVAAAGIFAGVATTMSSGKQLMESFQGVLKAVGTVFEQVARVVVPIAASTVGPVLTVLGNVLKDIGGIAVQVVGVAAPGLKAIGKLFGEVIGVVGEVIRVVLPLIQVALVPLTAITSALAQVISAVFIPVLQQFGSVVKEVADFLATAVAKLLSLLGMEPESPEFDPNAKRAQAVRQSQITDIRSALNRSYTMAFGGASKDVAGETLVESKKHTNRLDTIIGLMGGKGDSKGGVMSGGAQRDLGRIGFEYGGEGGRTVGRAVGSAVDFGKKAVQRIADPLDILGRMERLFN